MQFNRVVVGVDFSSASLGAARWAATQLAPHAEIVLVHVVREPKVPSFLQPYLPEMPEIVADLAPALYGGLRGLASVIGAERTRVEILVGAPDDALALVAAEVEADLICLGRRRRRRGAARFGDTTAQRLLAQTVTPVMVVPAARQSPPTRILAAIDEERQAHGALRAAWGIAQACEATLDVLHVLGPEVRGLVDALASTEDDAVQPDRVPSVSSWTMPAATTRSNERDDAHLFRLTRTWLEGHVEAIGAGGRRVATHVRVGDAGEEIVRFVQGSGVDLVVLERGGVQSQPALHADALPRRPYPLGSTTRLVLWAAPCPVLVLPPQLRVPDPMCPPPRRGTRSAPVRTASGLPSAWASGSGRLPPAAELERLGVPSPSASAA